MPITESPVLKNRATSSALFLIVFSTIISLSACHRQTPLPPELSAIQCQAGKEQHGQKKFGNEEVYFVCINNDLSNRLGSLKCESENRSLLCDEIQSYMLSRSAEGKVYAGQLPNEILQLDPSRSSTARDSSLIVSFHSSAPEQSPLESTGTGRDFLLTDAADTLPLGFTLTEGILCDNAANPLNEGRCMLRAKSSSLHWGIHVSIRQERGTPISPDEYREELIYWSKYIEKMVVNPKT